MKNRPKTMQISLLVAATLLTTSSAIYAQTAPPPALGQDTKGVPAVEETASDTNNAGENAVSATKKADPSTQKSSGGLLGSATIKESRRENGQVYLIELEHSSGAKQYIEETDSDGRIQPSSNDIEESPNLPKWKLGSW